MKTTSLQIWTPFTIGDNYERFINAVIPFFSTERASLRAFLAPRGLLFCPRGIRRCGHTEYTIDNVPGFETPQLLFVHKVRA